MDAAYLPYVKMLNRVLPQDIRILDWSPAPQGFSARFDCQSRTYRYYFPRGALDVPLMAEAAKRWVVLNYPACNLKTGQINNEPYYLVYPRFFLGQVAKLRPSQQYWLLNLKMSAVGVGWDNLPC